MSRLHILFVLYPLVVSAQFNTPFQMADAPTPAQRRDAFQEVSKHIELSDPAMQAGVVRLFNRESNDPNWETFEEAEWYEDYYQKVSEACQQVAVRFSNPDAWHALVYSNYNEDSNWGKWLASQPKAFPLLWQMAQNQNASIANRGLVMAAESMAYCEKAKTTDCVAVRSMSSAIKEAMQKRLKEGSSKDNFTVGAIEAYKVCGTKNDIPFLKTAITQVSKERYLDKDDQTAKQATIWLLKEAIDKISHRIG